MPVTVHHIFISPGHNFFGHHGLPAGEHETSDVATVQCRAGRGLEGDRFFDFKSDYKGQVTFFSWEIFEAVRREFNVPALSPAAFRRNVLISGLDLNALKGRRFALDGIEFEGTSEAWPCHWMNQAVAPGAERWLQGNGGLRAKILSDGELRRGSVSFAAPEVVGAA